MTRRCSLGPTVTQQDAAMERLKRRSAARKIAEGLNQARKIASGSAKVVSFKIDYTLCAPADRRIHAEVRYDAGLIQMYFSSFEEVQPWLREHGVSEDVLTGAVAS